MEPRELKKLLFDVDKACDRSLDDFLNDEMLQSSVER